MSVPSAQSSTRLFGMADAVAREDAVSALVNFAEDTQQLDVPEGSPPLPGFSSRAASRYTHWHTDGEPLGHSEPTVGDPLGGAAHEGRRGDGDQPPSLQCALMADFASSAIVPRCASHEQPAWDPELGSTRRQIPSELSATGLRGGSVSALQLRHSSRLTSKEQSGTSGGRSRVQQTSASEEDDELIASTPRNGSATDEASYRSASCGTVDGSNEQSHASSPLLHRAGGPRGPCSDFLVVDCTETGYSTAPCHSHPTWSRTRPPLGGGMCASNVDPIGTNGVPLAPPNPGTAQRELLGGPSIMPQCDLEPLRPSLERTATSAFHPPRPRSGVGLPQPQHRATEVEERETQTAASAISCTLGVQDVSQCDELGGPSPLLGTQYSSTHRDTGAIEALLPCADGGTWPHETNWDCPLSDPRPLGYSAPGSPRKMLSSACSSIGLATTLDDGCHKEYAECPWPEPESPSAASDVTGVRASGCGCDSNALPLAPCGDQVPEKLAIDRKAQDTVAAVRRLVEEAPHAGNAGTQESDDTPFLASVALSRTAAPAHVPTPGKRDRKPKARKRGAFSTKGDVVAGAVSAKPVGNLRQLYRVGMHVEGKTGCRWYPAVVIADERGGYVHIRWKDDGSELHLRVSEVRPATAATGTPRTGRTSPLRLQRDSSVGEAMSGSTDGGQEHPLERLEAPCVRTAAKVDDGGACNRFVESNHFVARSTAHPIGPKMADQSARGGGSSGTTRLAAVHEDTDSGAPASSVACRPWGALGNIQPLAAPRVRSPTADARGVAAPRSAAPGATHSAPAGVTSNARAGAVTADPLRARDAVSRQEKQREGILPTTTFEEPLLDASSSTAAMLVTNPVARCIPCERLAIFVTSEALAQLPEHTIERLISSGVEVMNTEAHVAQYADNLVRETSSQPPRPTAASDSGGRAVDGTCSSGRAGRAAQQALLPRLLFFVVETPTSACEAFSAKLQHVVHMAHSIGVSAIQSTWLARSQSALHVAPPTEGVLGTVDAADAPAVPLPLRDEVVAQTDSEACWICGTPIPHRSHCGILPDSSAEGRSASGEIDATSPLVEARFAEWLTFLRSGWDAVGGPGTSSPHPPPLALAELCGTGSAARSRNNEVDEEEEEDAEMQLFIVAPRPHRPGQTSRSREALWEESSNASRPASPSLFPAPQVDGAHKALRGANERPCGITGIATLAVAEEMREAALKLVPTERDAMRVPPNRQLSFSSPAELGSLGWTHGAEPRTNGQLHARQPNFDRAGISHTVMPPATASAPRRQERCVATIFASPSASGGKPLGERSVSQHCRPRQVPSGGSPEFRLRPSATRHFTHSHPPQRGSPRGSVTHQSPGWPLGPPEHAADQDQAWSSICVYIGEDYYFSLRQPGSSRLHTNTSTGEACVAKPRLGEDGDDDQGEEEQEVRLGRVVSFSSTKESVVSMQLYAMQRTTLSFNSRRGSVNRLTTVHLTDEVVDVEVRDLIFSSQVYVVSAANMHHVYVLEDLPVARGSADMEVPPAAKLGHQEGLWSQGATVAHSSCATAPRASCFLPNASGNHGERGNDGGGVAGLNHWVEGAPSSALVNVSRPRLGETRGSAPGRGSEAPCKRPREGDITDPQTPCTPNRPTTTFSSGWRSPMPGAACGAGGEEQCMGADGPEGRFNAVATQLESTLHRLAGGQNVLSRGHH